MRNTLHLNSTGHILTSSGVAEGLKKTVRGVRYKQQFKSGSPEPIQKMVDILGYRQMAAAEMGVTATSISRWLTYPEQCPEYASKFATLWLANHETKTKQEAIIEKVIVTMVLPKDLYEAHIAPWLASENYTHSAKQLEK